MRVKAITPIRVTDAELERRRRRYRDLSPPGVLLDLVNLPGPDAPTQLDDDAACEASTRLTLAEAARTDPREYELVLPDCVLDPGVDEGEALPVPMTGILKLSVSYLASFGHRLGAVTRNRAIGDELTAKLKHYGLDGSFAGLEVLDLDFSAVSDDGEWQEALTPVRDHFSGRATVVLNGCSAIDIPAGERGVPIVDPTRLALRLLGIAAADRLTPAGAAGR